MNRICKAKEFLIQDNGGAVAKRSGTSNVNTVLQATAKIFGQEGKMNKASNSAAGVARSLACLANIVVAAPPEM